MTQETRLIDELAKAKAIFQQRAICAAMGIDISQTSNATPNRAMDYSATFKGYEGGDPQGIGATPALAAEDLLESTRCDTCGDIHFPNPVPIQCETGDGI